MASSQKEEGTFYAVTLKTVELRSEDQTVRRTLCGIEKRTNQRPRNASESIFSSFEEADRKRNSLASAEMQKHNEIRYVEIDFPKPLLLAEVVIRKGHFGTRLCQVEVVNCVHCSSVTRCYQCKLLPQKHDEAHVHHRTMLKCFPFFLCVS